MSRIQSALQQTARDHRRAVIPFICGGFPSQGVLQQAIVALSKAGAPVIEVGFPFSDPIADGPVIAAAMHEALSPHSPSHGATPAQIFAEVAAVRAGVDAGLVAMVSFSIVFRVGVEAFVNDAASAGFDGLIVPDLPLEEFDELASRAASRGLAVPLLVAPTTAADRALAIAKASTGFVYLMARTGVTGESARSHASTPSRGGAESRIPCASEVTCSLSARVAALRAATSLPIACGFGISTRDHVRDVLQHADAAIVGSVLVKQMALAHKRHTDPVKALRHSYSELCA